ncbi:MAG: hypothetical protein Q8M29_04775 [Bacteroidota bacterium]|nr:hypothetical protein [Bacteroidota bacterium]
MKIDFLTIVAFFAINLSVNAQSTSKLVKPKTSQEKIDLCKEVENTYQIVSGNPRYKLTITSDVCEIVKRERQKDKTIIYKVNEYYSLKIYSEKDIPTIKLPLQYIIYKEN